MALNENTLNYTYMTDSEQTNGIGEHLAVAVSDVDSRSVKLVDAAGDLALGIVKYSADGPSRAMNVVTHGIHTAKAGGNIARGAAVMAGTDGRIVTATASKYAMGIAIQPAAANDLFEVHLMGPWRTPA
jgi:hypothetical protein